MIKNKLNIGLLTLIITIFLGLMNMEAVQKKNISVPQENKCLTCHKEYEIMPADFDSSDVHMHAQLSCAGCHGGDPTSEDQEIAMSKAKGFIGVPSKKEIPQFCGKCHSNIEVMRVFQPRISTDQVEKYYTSVHGKKLKAGDKNVADCVSCHTAHKIFPADDPRSTVYAVNVPSTCNQCHGDAELMNKYSLPSDQMEEYSKSVHGIALLENKDTGAPACNDCHGNHGAIPPGVASISYVCGTCHVNNAEYFQNSVMGEAFEMLDYHGCEECHGNHDVEEPSDDMVGVGEKSFCTDCHSEGDAGYLAAKTMRRDLAEMVQHYDSAKVLLEEVRNKGMDDVDIGFLLQDAHQRLIQSRTLIHTFDTTKVNAKANEGLGLMKKAINMADGEISEYYSRRNGFAAATAVFLILAVVLYFKLKDMEKKRKEKS
jgi:hypothetical protein